MPIIAGSRCQDTAGVRTPIVLISHKPHEGPAGHDHIDGIWAGDRHNKTSRTTGVPRANATDIAPRIRRSSL
jgi:hypothetical protein